MDLTLTEQQRAFRDEVRAWLAANVPGEPLAPSNTAEGLAAHRRWEQRLYEAGYAAVHWPVEFGGRGASHIDTAIFAEEYARAGAPERVNALALGLAGPTLMAYGTPQQQRRWLPGMLSCEAIWSQGFSEPDAGSDLAALSTTADRDGDAYVVNGQKVWTTLGRVADWIFTLVRTDRQAPRHKGLTLLMIPMDAPGVEVRPITQINGDAGFAEVFLTDVRVPLDHAVGPENEGWRVAMTTLQFERGTGLGSHVRFSRQVRELARLVTALGADGDAATRDEVARLFARTEVYRHHMYRTLTSLARGGELGPEASLNKLFWSDMETDIHEAGLTAMGPLAELAGTAGAADEALGEAGELWAEWHKRYLYARAARIYAGTNEIQKNIIAERVLGLPKEPRGGA